MNHNLIILSLIIFIASIVFIIYFKHRLIKYYDGGKAIISSSGGKMNFTTEQQVDKPELHVTNCSHIQYGHLYAQSDDIKHCVQCLWEKYSSYPTINIDISLLPSNDKWSSYLDENINEHIKRIVNADLSYPILITPNFKVIDGLHRIFKARMLNHQKINAKIINL